MPFILFIILVVVLVNYFKVVGIALSAFGKIAFNGCGMIFFLFFALFILIACCC